MSMNGEVGFMYDYLHKLQHTFFEEPALPELQQEIDDLYGELKLRLSQDDRKKLLKLTDAYNALQDEIALASFVAGFRLSHGIMAELNEEPPYSFARAEEEAAIKAARNS